MIARLEVTRGTLTEYPLAEKVRGGWQNGGTFYPAGEVTKITPLHVTSEPQGEPSDAQVEAGCLAFYEHASGLTSWERLVEYDAVIADRYREGIRRALRAAGGVR